MGMKRKAVIALVRGAGKAARGGVLGAGLTWAATRSRSGLRKKPTRTVGTQTPRRALRPRSRTAKHKGPAFKIGSFAGELIASKPVKMAKPGSRILRRQYGSETIANRLWLGANTIQSEYYLFSLIAEGILANVLKRLGDTRADKDTSVPTSFLARLRVNFVRDESLTGGPGDVLRDADINIQNDTSFNGIVYNGAGSFNVVTVNGVPQPSNTGLNKLIFDQAVQGFYPQGIFAYRGIPTDPAGTLGPEILRETQLGKMTIKLDIRKTHKYQNVTPASAGRAEGTSNFNVNAIDANPLEGKLMTYRNLSPTWNKGWLVRQGASVDPLENFSGRPRTTTEWDYKQITPTPVSNDLPDLNEFESMPLRPSTVYSNGKSAGRVHFPPGGFKVFKTHFTYDGSIRRLCRDVTQVTNYIGGVESSLYAGKYPPLGSSFMLCLLPTIKTTVGETLTVAFDYVTDGKVHCTKYKGGSLPTTNFIES